MWKITQLRFGGCWSHRRPLVEGILLAITVVLMLLTGAAASADTVDIRVIRSPDDAEESSDGTVSKASSDLELVTDRGDIQTVGIRFRGVGIPQGASITGAYIQFTVDEATTEPTQLSIAGQASNNAAKFSGALFDISSRPRTAANVGWIPQPWITVGEAGEAQRTPDLAPVIQEIVNRSGWSSGNALAIIVNGSGRRVAESYNGDPAAAPLLHVEFEAAAPLQPPTVNALTTSDPTPTITGTWDQSADNTLSVTVNAITYTLGDGSLSSSSGNWSLTIPDGDALSDGTYDVTATVSDAEGNSVDDLTSGELVIDTGVGTTTPIEHVIVVVGENRTFDHLFGVYTPGAGQSVDNLLSRGIVDADGSPGPNFAVAMQNKAVASGAYSIDPPRTQPYLTLPRPSTTDAKGQPNYVPDLRFPDDLPNGPFQITHYIDYADYSGDPVHRFFQMWQQVSTGALDLVTWVSETAGEGPDSPSTQTGSCGEGSFSSEGMGFYNMSTGDASYLKSLAQQYAISDNFHQGVMGGTGANYFYIATGDVAFYNENGAPAMPPSNQIENPDPQPGSENCYTQDGFEGGSYVNCADSGQPGVADIRNYLDGLQYTPFRNGNCAADTWYLVNNYTPGYFPNGAPRPLGPDQYTVPPQTVPTIAEALANKGVTWKWYSGGREGGGGYCAVCDALTFSTAVMTSSLKNNLVGLNEFWEDVADTGAMPAVSFIAPNTGKSGHPGNSNLAKLEDFYQRVIDAVQGNPALWASTAILITTDEGGGYYDSAYIQPIDFFGGGPRIPFIAVSPYAKAGYVDHTYYDQASILKFIEANWRLAPLSSRSRDGLPNPITGSDPYVPVNRPAIGNLMNLFDFSN